MPSYRKMLALSLDQISGTLEDVIDTIQIQTPKASGSTAPTFYAVAPRALEVDSIKVILKTPITGTLSVYVNAALVTTGSLETYTEAQVEYLVIPAASSSLLTLAKDDVISVGLSSALGLVSEEIVTVFDYYYLYT